MDDKTEIIEGTKKNLAAAGNATAEKLGEYKEEIMGAKDAAKDKMSEMKENAGEKFDDMKSRVNEMKDDTKVKMDEMKERAKDGMENMAENAADEMNELNNPDRVTFDDYSGDKYEPELTGK